MKAIVLLSGGIDSCVSLAYALSLGRECFCLSFNYGQRHIKELESASSIAKQYQLPFIVISIDKSLFFQAHNCSLTDHSLQLEHSSQTNNTYVPCRNLLFLAHAACYAEIHNAQEIYFGANADDISHYPDCRPQFTSLLEKTLSSGSPHNPKIITPLQTMTKKEIISLGNKLHAPLQATWSCYNPIHDTPCGRCQACLLRNEILQKNS